MTDEAMSPLRRRMIEDMTIRKLAPKTQQGHIRTINDFERLRTPHLKTGHAPLHYLLGFVASPSALPARAV